MRASISNSPRHRSNWPAKSGQEECGHLQLRPRELHCAMATPLRGNSESGSTHYFLHNCNPASFCSYTVASPTACPGTGPSGSDGTSQRNGYYGPAQRDVDMGLFREFGIYERLKFQLRAEVVNVFNVVTLGNPNSTLSSATVGQITGQAAGFTMREIQLGGRLTF